MSGYCKYCDTLTNNIVEEYKDGHLVWSGCRGCYTVKTELVKHAEKKQ